MNDEEVIVKKPTEIKPFKCPNCNGYGTVTKQKKTCHSCSGRGIVFVPQEIEVIVDPNKI